MDESLDPLEGVPETHITGITPRGRETLNKVYAAFLAGKTLAEIADSLHMSVDLIRLLVAIDAVKNPQGY